ncbi:UNVERIFIED_CONTAM: hypothetical protein PYX00_007513 [Menopon gallinae]|uniref:DM10 domain-containing protein n=1 Tax=Menopon gallinae TaxID=328185 RepID=A0AAW2HJW1_9NEOP
MDNEDQNSNVESFFDNSCDVAIDHSSKYLFVVDWYDPVAQLVKNYLMSFYPHDQTVELYDLKNRKPFLRRCKQEGVALENLYKSAIVTVMSRQMKVVDYGDAKTRSKFETELSLAFVLIKPDILPKIGDIIEIIQNERFKIIHLKMGLMSQEAASEFYKEHEGQSFFAELIKFMTSGPSVAIQIIGENAQRRWRDLVGPVDAEVAKREAPHTLRAIYGTDIARNGVHCSKDEEYFVAETEVWFGKRTELNKRTSYIQPTCVLKDSTCCVIKPHAVTEGTCGKIIKTIVENGFKITAMELMTMDTTTAEEFLEVYKGVVPEYSAMVVQFTSGPLLALEVVDTNNPACTQETFRKLAGPADPDIARKLRPTTLRALFGRTKVQNAIHCTDLPDDAPLEVEYFFQVLQI